MPKTDAPRVQRGQITATAKIPCRSLLEKELVQLGITTRDFAVHCGLPHTTVWRLAAGKTKEPFFSVAVRIAKELGMEPLELWPLRARRK